MDSAEWDARYRAAELNFGRAPTEWVVDQTSYLSAGSALDVGCGDGRDTLFLATRGWSVTAVDFSQVALDRARTVASHAPRRVRDRITWTRCDVELDPLPSSSEPGGFDLAILSFVHPETLSPADFLARVCATLAVGGRLVLITHKQFLPETPTPENMSVITRVEFESGEHDKGADLALVARRDS